MMKNLRPGEEKIIKDISSLFRLKNKLNYAAVKDIRDLFGQEKGTKTIKETIFRDIKNYFELEEKEEENYYKTVKVNNIWSNNYIE